MARISGVDLPREKRVEIGLTYIFGIGLKTSQAPVRMSIAYIQEAVDKRQAITKARESISKAILLLFIKISLNGENKLLIYFSIQ